MGPDPLGPITIGAREIYDAVLRLTAAVDRLTAQHVDTTAQITDHEARVRALERRQWPLPTLSVLVAIAALVVAAISAGAR